MLSKRGTTTGVSTSLVFFSPVSSPLIVSKFSLQSCEIQSHTIIEPHQKGLFERCLFEWNLRYDASKQLRELKIISRLTRVFVSMAWRFQLCFSLHQANLSLRLAFYDSPCLQFGILNYYFLLFWLTDCEQGSYLYAGLLCKPKRCHVKKCPSCYTFLSKNQEDNISRSSICFIPSSDFIIWNNSLSRQYFMEDTILCWLTRSRMILNIEDGIKRLITV